VVVRPDADPAHPLVPLRMQVRIEQA
jgi:hypothetical protein